MAILSTQPAVGTMGKREAAGNWSSFAQLAGEAKQVSSPAAGLEGHYVFEGQRQVDQEARNSQCLASVSLKRWTWLLGWSVRHLTVFLYQADTPWALARKTRHGKAEVDRNQEHWIECWD